MPPMSPPSLPERSAHATIRGYLYQTRLGVLRWLDLDDDETLVVEGDEEAGSYGVRSNSSRETPSDTCSRIW